MGKEQSDHIRPTPSSPVIPDMIGPYKIESLLEKGGMSVLYLGTHPESKEPTTIKVLSEKYLSQPDIVHRFLMEAEIIAMADHQNIVKLYGHGEWEGGLYIAMEFIQGISLRQYILQTPMSLKRALEMIIDIAYALCHLHTHGVIHRDLKPENILVSDNGIIKVIDFGIAQLLTQSPEEKKNQRQGLVGTPIYMSPEQRDNPESVSYPSDIYSLGIIAYELILGKLSLGQIHLSLMPKGIQKILAKSLQPNPADRYQDIVDFITDLSAYLHSNAIEKEKLAGDQLGELAESLRNAYQSLHPPPPIWPEVECGIVSHKTSLTSGGFYDFIKLSDGRQVLLAGEAVTDSVKGLLYTSVMRGMAKALTKHSDKMVEELYELLCCDHMDTLFALACLILDPEQDRFEYFSCGYGNLLILPYNRDNFTVINPTHKLIGIDTIGKISFETHPWHRNDTLILFAKPYPLNAPTNPPEFIEEQWWIQSFLDRSHTPMPKQLETAYRRAKAQKIDFWQKQAVNMIGIHRK